LSVDLVDSSAWIAVFRRRDPLDLPAIVDVEEIVTCLLDPLSPAWPNWTWTWPGEP